MLKPKIGDTIIIEGIVSEIRRGWSSDGEDVVYFTTPGILHQSTGVDVRRIKEIIPKPWTPTVGDKVNVVGKMSLSEGYTILNIHGNGSMMSNGKPRLWATIAFLDDMPDIVNIDCIIYREPT